MFRSIITALLRLMLRIFFRRIEIAGLARVPAETPLLFVLNHPNALVDPIFLLALAPRRVSFLAKAPLFKMPVIGALVRAMDSLPVYRQQDAGTDMTKNRETFDRAREVLRAGGAIAVCPEGVSHSEPHLQALKTGAARIALGAVATARRPLDLEIVPAGLYYTSKRLFRSAALLCFGEPVRVEKVELDERGDVPKEAARELTKRIEMALRGVTLNAEQKQILETIALAEHIYARWEDAQERTLARELERRRRFIAGYDFHRAHSPEKLAALTARIQNFAARLKQFHLDARDLQPPAEGIFNAYVGKFFFKLALLIVVSPLAVLGALIHYPTYRLVGFLATKLSKGYDDMVATIKMLGAALLFPLTWLIFAGVVWWLSNWRIAVLSLLIAPFAGYAAMWYAEQLGEAINDARAFFVRRAHRAEFAALLAEREAIRREILTFGDEAAVLNL
jgi:glycerol-3-phosphate O-acyltransferase/dihydroxyacetone phosphate acyltransferase